jgi:hypothetical protein
MSFFLIPERAEVRGKKILWLQPLGKIGDGSMSEKVEEKIYRSEARSDESGEMSVVVSIEDVKLEVKVKYNRKEKPIWDTKREYDAFEVEIVNLMNGKSFKRKVWMGHGNLIHGVIGAEMRRNVSSDEDAILALKAIADDAFVFWNVENLRNFTKEYKFDRKTSRRLFEMCKKAYMQFLEIGLTHEQIMKIGVKIFEKYEDRKLYEIVVR